MKKDNGKLFKIILCSSMIGIINGLLGGGGGMLCVPALTKLGNLSTKQAHATAVFVMLPLSIISSIVYSIKVQTNLTKLVLVTIGALLGGLLGTKFLKNVSSKVLDYIFVAVILISGLRMLF